MPTHFERPSSEQPESGEKQVTFYVAERGLQTSIEDTLSKDDYENKDPESFEPNNHWSRITVESEADKDRWIELRNEWLSCAWTPNQERDERTQNAERMREIEGELRELEGKARDTA